MRVDQRPRRLLVIVAALALCCLPLTGCDESEAPVLPSKIEVVSGDAQFSKRGTDLPLPLVVRLRFEDGSLAPDFNVRFQVVELSGQLSTTLVRSSSVGRASARLTLPDATGTVRVRASLDGSSAVAVDFTATSSEYYCPEEDPTVTQKFFPTGSLLLFTNQSVFHSDAGLIQIEWGAGKFTAASKIEFPAGSAPYVPWDAAFSRSGDFFLAWTHGSSDRVIEIAPNFSYDEAGFARLDAFLGSEITTTPAGILIGCDEFGPFSVGCRDTLARFEDALYAGLNQVVNNDAVAVDPASSEIYFIVSDFSGANASLMRLGGSGAPAGVAALTPTEALNAKGMVVDDTDGAVYILVESSGVKSIVKVTAGGVKSTEVDFFTARGAGDAAGVQSDLAIDGRFRFLFTLDTLNDVLLLYDIGQTTLSVITATAATDPEALSKAAASGERVGLVVVP